MCETNQVKCFNCDGMGFIIEENDIMQEIQKQCKICEGYGEIDENDPQLEEYSASCKEDMQNDT
jgi:DnaJ-class molecular chaperone